jgi:hypothetical protein
MKPYSCIGPLIFFFRSPWVAWRAPNRQFFLIRTVFQCNNYCGQRTCPRSLPPAVLHLRRKKTQGGGGRSNITDDSSPMVGLIIQVLGWRRQRAPPLNGFTP